MRTFARGDVPPVSKSPRPFPARVAIPALAALASLAASAQAGIASTSGAILEIAHPTGTLSSNTLESDTTMYVWFERTVTGPGALTLNHVGPGTVNSNGSANPQTVSPGFAHSYLVHFDQAGGGNATLGASITFEGMILGVWHTNAGLNGSDATFAPAGLTYASLNARGFELGTGGGQDRYAISADGHTLTILQARSSGSGVDQLRILVNPEPGTGALLGLGVAGLAALVLRRRPLRHAAAA